eukprot:Tbor_TRINITY_DN6128_c1_g9::TRINITY_DN6128_c1_g9_i1::g.22712::m.22712
MSVPFWKEAFAYFDSENRGKISDSDAMILTSGLGFAHNSTEELNAMVRSMDSTCAGLISANQMNRILSRRAMEHDGPEEIWRAFVLIDSSSAGKINKEQLKDQLHCDRRISVSQINRVCEILDDDTVDGISYDAWKCAFMRKAI